MTIPVPASQRSTHCWLAGWLEPEQILLQFCVYYKFLFYSAALSGFSQRRVVCVPPTCHLV